MQSTMNQGRVQDVVRGLLLRRIANLKEHLSVNACLPCVYVHLQ